MGLLSDLGEGPLGLDTSIFIYFVEEHPTYLPLVEPVYEAIDGGEIQGGTSALTLLKTIVVPLRSGNESLARRY